MRLKRSNEKAVKRKLGDLSSDDNDDANEELDMLPLDYVEEFVFDQYKPGTCFGFLSPEAARLCGALSDRGDCSSRNALDPLCLGTPRFHQTEALGTKKPSADYVVVAVVKMNAVFVS